MNEIERFHCCATCIHFQVSKVSQKLVTRCSRLGYDTKPQYRFSCWSPKERVQKRIDQLKVEEKES